MEDSRRQIMNLFRQCDQVIKRSVEKKVKDTGLYRSQHRLLMILGKHPDCSQTVLAERMDVSSAAVAVALKKLEKSGYIERTSDEMDSRMNHVVITPKGHEAIRISCIYFQEIEGALFEGFSEKELEAVGSFLKRIIQNGESYCEALPERDCEMEREKLFVKEDGK